MTITVFKPRQQRIAMTITAFVAALFLWSCDKETVSTDSPAFKIAESEKLTIPAIIDLPLNAPHGNSRVATFYAQGVQRYKSQVKAGSNPVSYEWVFVAPQADLFDASNKKVGTHSAGPTWQLFGTADSIYGQAFTPAKAVASPDPTSIDWLQLTLKKEATGVFANVNYIQRIATTGGKAPTQLPSSAGETVEVNYTAIYRFSRKNP